MPLLLLACQINHCVFKVRKFWYKITKHFPTEELYGITSQIRRASISITNNIAEGFGRITNKDKRSFYFITKGSTLEVQNLLIISEELGYITKKDYEKLYYISLEILKMLNSIISSFSWMYFPKYYLMRITKLIMIDNNKKRLS